MNRTILERARSMRIHAGLPKQFWADAVNTAAYLINRGPSVPLNCGLPEEAWTGKEVNLSHLRVFGCIAYMHIELEDRDKFDAKSRKCVFIGYDTNSYGYRLYDFENRKTRRSIDVVFNESALYRNRLSQPEEAEVKSDFVEFEGIPDSNVLKPQDTNIQSTPQADPQTPPLRRSTRVVKPPIRYSPSLNYLLLTDSGEPECFEEALQVETKEEWEHAMDDEMDSLSSNQTWELVELPEGKRALHNKWVYRIKEESDGSKRFKARLVVKGFEQKQGIDYTEIFSPVVKISTIRCVLNIVAVENLHLEQLDVKTAFLHGDLEEDIYMHQPEGYVVKGKENQVCKLRKSLYGLKQAPRQWYKKFDTFMTATGFSRCHGDHCCYFKKLDTSYLILLLYVDDMLVAGSSMDEIVNLKAHLSKEFAMKDLGSAKKILGMRISRDRANRKLKLSQEEYVKKVLKRFNMESAKPVSTPLASHFKLSKEKCAVTDEEKNYMAKVPYASAVGSLMYAMVNTRPDIAHAVGVVSRFMANPGKEHWEAVKWILRYLRGTSDSALCFGGSDICLQGFVDSDLAGDIDSRKSTTGYVFTLGSAAVSWVSRLQKIVTISTTEAEYVAATEACKEMVWLRSFMKELGKEQDNSKLFSDSQSAIHLAKNAAFHSRTKHIDIKYHFIRSLLEDGQFTLEKIHTRDNPADMFTKVVTVEKLKSCSASVGLSA
jgi:ATP-binding cassette subfamily B (MDR/TAP) protein 1